MNDNQTTLEKCLGMMDEEVRGQINEALERYDSAGILIFENVDLSSSLIGERFAIGYGPKNTLSEPPADGKCSVTPPRGNAWQYYLKGWS